MSDKTDSEIAMELRQRSLHFWIAASQESYPAKITIPDSKPVNGVFIATDTQEHRIRINRLQTPLGTYDKVVLRGSDVDAIEFSL
ncbi:hypothetical protein BG015_006760 [Linnemannia schmuckeri]|uniref:Uncharacterized protein n=1 Tax=Linnemannia schmuckeri TaxID=64567 RepID=A0A9P5VBW4_9FUNG|nr:hypothetical protein BG015_006760 [Linnemannia schmuckeri]